MLNYLGGETGLWCLVGGFWFLGVVLSFLGHPPPQIECIPGGQKDGKLSSFL